jgi:predicted permease
MHDFLGDIRYGLRLLGKNPGFTAVALLTLAIGIGATTAMFSVVNGVLLSQLPFEDPDRLVLIKERIPKLVDHPIGITGRDVLTFTRENSSFDGIAGFIDTQSDLSGRGSPQKIETARVGWNLFSILGVSPIMGRTFTPAEDHPDSYLAIVSYRFWKQQLGGAHDVIGQRITLDRKPYEVVGVMPREFQFPLRTEKPVELWVPMGFTPAELSVGNTNFAFGALARLKRAASMAQAQSDVERIAKRIEQALPAGARGDLQIFGALVSLKEDTVGDVRKPLLVLFLAVIFVLLIAVVNVANLLLARGTARQRELAVRLALGATTKRLLAQLLAESVILGIIGGALGLLLAAVATNALLAMVPSTVPRLQTVGIDGHILLFVVGISLLAGLAFGSVPALFALRTNVNDNLKEGGRGISVGRHHQRVRASFVVAQVALALMLLAGAGLLLRSFRRVLEVDPGFRAENVTTAAISLPASQYATAAQLRSFYTQLQSKLEQIPGAKAAALTTDLPLETHRESAFAVEGYQPPPGGGLNLTAFSLILGDYFKAMGIPLIRGRLFLPSDDFNKQKVVIISQSIAEKYFASRDPIGGHLKLGTASGGAPWMTVVGVVGDVKPFGLDSDSLPHSYMPYQQLTDDTLNGSMAEAINLAVRTSGDPASAAASIRTAVWSLDRQVPVTDLRTMEQVISESNAPRRFNMVLVAFFAGAALLLAAIGLYGVMSYSVAQRTHEIGVRMTLGALPADILRMVLGSGVSLVLIGILIGLAGALATSRLLTSFLFDVRPSDPLTFAFVALLLASVALFASMAPALRATRVDPMIALRDE